MFIILLKCIFKTKIISESKNIYLWVHESTILKSLYWFLEKAMAPHSRTLAWKTPWTEKPDRLQSMGSQRVRHDRATSLSLTSLTVRRGSPKESGSGNTRRCRFSRRRGQQCWASVWGLLCKALRTGYHRLWWHDAFFLISVTVDFVLILLFLSNRQVSERKSLTRVQLFETPWAIQSMDSPGQNPGMGSLSLVQGIFPTQGSKPLHCRWIL